MKLTYSWDLKPLQPTEMVLRECHNKPGLQGGIFLSNVPFLPSHYWVCVRLDRGIGQLIEVNRLGHFQLNGNCHAMCWSFL